MKFKKRSDGKSIAQNLRPVYRISKKKKLLNKGVIYEYILPFAGWRSVYWVVVGAGRYILVDGGWWWVIMDIFWLVLGGGG